MKEAKDKAVHILQQFGNTRAKTTLTFRDSGSRGSLITSKGYLAPIEIWGNRGEMRVFKIRKTGHQSLTKLRGITVRKLARGLTTMKP